MPAVVATFSTSSARHPKSSWLTCGNTSNERLQEVLCSTLPAALELLAANEPLPSIAKLRALSWPAPPAGRAQRVWATTDSLCNTQLINKSNLIPSQNRVKKYLIYKLLNNQ